ncbi:MAG: hypothetical protein K2P81_13825 [Bacteriovoracaceae bacterium]|nr:hypothetical protein [Bacteriovoracaceae bacterium]
MSAVTIKRGKILVYRFFEIGSEVDLKKLATLMQEKQNTTRFRIDRPGKTGLVIANDPVTVHLGPMNFQVEENTVQAEVDVRLWDFGGMSICFQIPIKEGSTWDDLVRVAAWLERDPNVDLVAKNKARDFQQEIKETITVLNDWATSEDYVVYFIQDVEGVGENAMELFDLVDVPALIMAEPKERLSDQMKKTVRDYATQYARGDLCVIDWNSALVVEPSGSMDVPRVLEFANSQLLEMRYYDDLLDEKLDSLYKGVMTRKSTILSNFFSRQAEEAGQIYLEIAEVVENVENSLKVVGDFYLATVFRTASARYRFSDWQKSINEKLGNLAEVSKLLHSRVAETRSFWMELIIIVLIAVELVPFFRELFH